MLQILSRWLDNQTRRKCMCVLERCSAGNTEWFTSKTWNDLPQKSEVKYHNHDGEGHPTQIAKELNMTVHDLTRLLSDHLIEKLGDGRQAGASKSSYRKTGNIML